MQNAKIKLAEQALAAHKRLLATSANKDQVRRSIAAAQARLDELKAEDTDEQGD